MTLLQRAERAVRTQAMVGAALAIIAGQMVAGVLLLATLLGAPLLRERKRGLILPHWLVNVAVALATVWLTFEIFNPARARDPLQRLLLVVSYLCLLQGLRAFEAVRTPRDVGQTMVLSLITVAIASLCGWGLLFGIVLGGYLFLGAYGIVVLNIASQGFEADAASQEIAPGSLRGLGRGVAGGTLGVMVISVMVFVLFPRLHPGLWPVRPFEGAAITGFDDRSSLEMGDINRIQQDETPVMWVWIRRGGQPIGSPNLPLYLRGKTFDLYERVGNRYVWTDTFADEVPVPRRTVRTFHERRWIDDEIRRDIGWIYEDHKPAEMDDGTMEELKIELQDPGGRALFAPYPTFRLLGNDDDVGTVERRLYDATVWLPQDRPRKGRIMYTLTVPAPDPTDRSRPLPRVARFLDTPDAAGLRSRYADRGILGAVSDRVRNFVDETILRGRPISDPEKIASEIETFLLTHYAYSRSFSMTPEGVEPIEHFLADMRRPGHEPEGRHCEYFAAAMTILCRSKDIPTRLVAGFRGGEFNSVSNFYLVRKKHAHSWVEAFVPIPERDAAGEIIATPSAWVTYDPTPADTSGDSGWAGWLAQLVDYLRAGWRHHIDEYGAEHQDWLRRLISRITRPTGRWGHEQAKRFEGWLKQFFGESAGGVSIGLLSGAAVLGVAGMVLTAWLLLRRRRKKRELIEADLARGAPRRQVDFYLRLLELLARRGYTKSTAQTAREFTNHLSRVAAAVLPMPDVRHVAELYYRCRYGEREVDPRRQAEIQRILSDLAAEPDDENVPPE